MSRSRADTRLSDLPENVELSDNDTPCAPFNFPDEIEDTIAYINEIVAERQKTYNIILSELKIANTKKLFEICLKQQNEQIAADRRHTLSDSLISEIVRATAGGELTEENSIRFWALCMEKNAHGEYKKMINVPERPSHLSEVGKIMMWKICWEMNEYGPLMGKIEMPDKPESIERAIEVDIEEVAQDGRRRTLMMDGEWHQAVIHERRDGLVDSMIVEVDEATLADEHESCLHTDRPRTRIDSDSSWESFSSDADEDAEEFTEESTVADNARALNRRSWNEGHELR